MFGEIFSDGDLSFIQEFKSAYIFVFMENHPFENFSPHTLLVFMENHGFELLGFPLNSRK